jgi:hypothetical protein
MFAPTGAPVRRARPQVGNLTPLAIPARGLNARDALSVMGPEFAIQLENVIVEPYGLRTRKGYSEWATNVGPGVPISTMMSYYPATASPAPLAVPASFGLRSNLQRLIVEPRVVDPPPPAGKLFAATGGSIFDVTLGGVGPWAPQAGVGGGSDFWTWLNFQNIAGAFLVACNNAGGYAIYNGAAWSVPVQGVGVGQIDHVNPALFCYVTAHMRRLWFIEKDATSAWYLPVDQITGAATEFDFGSQFKHGGALQELVSWTIDGGAGVNDYLVAISSQGDVVVYKGTDPNDPNDWSLVGVWYVGALAVGRRACVNTGGDVQILSHFGVTPLSLLLAAKELGTLEAKRTSYLISPLIARLMRDYSTLPGWAISVVPKEELLTIRVPTGALNVGGQFLVLKTLTAGWSVLRELPYADFVTVDYACFAGTTDGRVVRAFNGVLDNVRLASTILGDPIQCRVTPAFQPMGTPGQQKVFKLVRPTFLTTMTPSLVMQILTDYGPPRPAITPTLPTIEQSLWDQAKWNLNKWSGLQAPIKEWLGCHGVGFTATVQLDYRCGGDTLLASIDFWSEQGGVM